MLARVQVHLRTRGKRSALAKRWKVAFSSGSPHSRALLAAADSKKHDAPIYHRYSSNSVAMRK